jgi:hypothetical protein
VNLVTLGVVAIGRVDLAVDLVTLGVVATSPINLAVDLLALGVLGLEALSLLGTHTALLPRRCGEGQCALDV